MQTNVVNNEAELFTSLSQYIVDIISKCILNSQLVRIGLSGGSMVQILSEIFKEFSNDHYNCLHFFFCDERYAKNEDDDDFTFKLYNKQLFEKRLTSKHNIHKLNLNVSLSESCKEYENCVTQHFNINSENDIPKFDLLFLGLGPDGHTASLFPFHEVLNDNTNIFQFIENSPKPPLQRVTMTLNLINNASNICFIATGQSKAQMIKSCIDSYNSCGSKEFPASLVRSTAGQITWFIDKHAADILHTHF